MNFRSQSGAVVHYLYIFSLNSICTFVNPILIIVNQPFIVYTPSFFLWVPLLPCWHLLITFLPAILAFFLSTCPALMRWPKLSCRKGINGRINYGIKWKNHQAKYRLSRSDKGITGQGCYSHYTHCEPAQQVCQHNCTKSQDKWDQWPLPGLGNFGWFLQSSDHND